MCSTNKVENPAQHQFCTSGYIAATGIPLLACSYDANTPTDINNYDLLHLGRNQTEDVRWVRVPPNGRVTTPGGQDLRGVDNLDLQPINSERAYFSRTNMCEYMTNCYNHDGGLNYQDCQEYWNTSVECTIQKTFLQGINPGYWLFLGVIAALIVLVLVIGLSVLVNRIEMDTWKANYYVAACNKLPDCPSTSKTIK